MYTTSKPVALVAEEDIICYKVVRLDNIFYNKYEANEVPPVQIINPTKLDENPLINVIPVIEAFNAFGFAVELENNQIYEIHRGYHAFTDALDACKSRIYTNEKSIAIAQFIIPKGTTYYRGIYFELRDKLRGTLSCSHNAVAEVMIFTGIVDIVGGSDSVATVYSFYQKVPTNCAFTEDQD